MLLRDGGSSTESQCLVGLSLDQSQIQSLLCILIAHNIAAYCREKLDETKGYHIKNIKLFLVDIMHNHALYPISTPWIPCQVQ